MKKFRFRFVFASVFMLLSLFVPAPAMARVCMIENPTTIVTHEQLAESVDITNCTFNLYTPKYTSGTEGHIGAAWGVSNNGTSAADVKCTVTGIAQCSDVGGTFAIKGSPSNTNGGNCWCKMTTPRVGAWVFGSIYGSADSCVARCAYNCAINVFQNTSGFRAAVLALP